MTSKLPEWIGQVPLKTVGVLCATHLFGKNIESRQILLAGKRYFHNAVENVVGYVLNPILPPLNTALDAGASADSDAVVALKHIRDCFNFIFHIQIEYFKVLEKLFPKRFVLPGSGRELKLNQFMAKEPTLINSERRYLILAKVDGVQPFDLNLDWNAEFDWISESVRTDFHSRLVAAQDAYAETLRLGEWYAGRDKNLIMPLRTILNDLSAYFDHLGLAGYLMARRVDRTSPETSVAIRQHLAATCEHLERFVVDMLRVNVFSIIMHDRDRLDGAAVGKAIRARAEDEGYIGNAGYEARCKLYLDALDTLHKQVGYNPPESVNAGPAA